MNVGGWITSIGAIGGLGSGIGALFLVRGRSRKLTADARLVTGQVGRTDAETDDLAVQTALKVLAASNKRAEDAERRLDKLEAQINAYIQSARAHTEWDDEVAEHLRSAGISVRKPPALLPDRITS